MSVPPVVAVVIPCRNDAPFLEECLAALAAQTRPADRVIVVDNGSTDASAAVARRFGAEVCHEPAIGIWPAAARGYDEAIEPAGDRAPADIIARLDADSRPEPDWLSQVVRSFVADASLGVLTGSAEFYGGGPIVNYIGEKWYIGGLYTWVTPWLGHPPVFGSNFAMRRRVWLRLREVVDSTNPGIHDDLDLSIRLRPSDGVRYDPTLRMPVSARPLASPRALWRRLRKVVPTFAVSWPEGAAWHRERPRPDEGDEPLYELPGH
ncbi:glycosyltransferase [Microbacterium sp.]|uniref:glycosyltransferase n=1 Tax=Microbacterium sp. TaxID=51671 RepID=UPI0037CC0811